MKEVQNKIKMKYPIIKQRKERKSITRMGSTTYEIELNVNIEQ